MNIDLSEEEVIFLHNILEREISDTKSEIHHSENFSFKEDLKKQVRFIQDVINKLSYVRKLKAG